MKGLFDLGQPLNRLLWITVAGLINGLAFAPWYLWFLFPISFMVIFFIFQHVSGCGEGFRLGLAFAVLFYLVHAYWFYSFHPVALPFMLLYLGILSGLWGCFSARWPTAYLMAAGWLIVQLFLGFGFHAFPWSRLSTALAVHPSLIQPVQYLGELVWGNLLILCSFLGASCWFQRRVRYDFCFVLVLVVTLFGCAQWWSKPARPIETSQVLMVQPNVESGVELEPGESNQLLRLYRTTKKNARRDDLVIWPETAVLQQPLKLEGERVLWRSDMWKQYFSGLIDGRFHLFFGTTFTDPKPNELDHLNAAVMLDPRSEPVGFYTKRYPVPGGEWLPMMGQWSWMETLGNWLGTLGYRSGQKGGLVPVRINGRELQAGVQICFEDAFGHYVRSQVLNGADFLINISNDSWSRSRASHWQHFYRARIRAVETGRTVLRNGNTGVTAIIKPNGKIPHSLKPYETGILRGQLYEPQSTVYLWFGHMITVAYLILLLVGSILEKDEKRQVVEPTF